jgi:hypothetical protein
MSQSQPSCRRTQSNLATFVDQQRIAAPLEQVDRLRRLAIDCDTGARLGIAGDFHQPGNERLAEAGEGTRPGAQPQESG